MPKTREIAQYQDPVLARIYDEGATVTPKPVKAEVRVMDRRPRREYKLPDLGLRSDKSFVMNGQTVSLPIGVETALTVAEIKQVAKVYRGMVMFVKNGEGWEQVRDDEKVSLSQPQKFESREPPKPDPIIQEFRSTPHYSTD